MSKYDFSELVNNVVNDVMNSIIDPKDNDLTQVRLIATLAAQAAALTLIRTGLIPEQYEIPESESEE